MRASILVSLLLVGCAGADDGAIGRDDPAASGRIQNGGFTRWTDNTVHYQILERTPTDDCDPATCVQCDPPADGGTPHVGCKNCSGLVADGGTNEVTALHDGINQMMAETPVIYVEDPTASPLLTYQHDYCGDSSHTTGVGTTDVRVEFTTFSQRTIMHETGHALGLMHEQQRSDRDNYLTVYPDCELPGQGKQWAEKGWTKYESLAPFDFGSIMMYSSFSLSLSGKHGCKVDHMNPSRQICCPTQLQNSSAINYEYKFKGDTTFTTFAGDNIPGDNLDYSAEDINTIYQMYPPLLDANDAGDLFGRAAAAGDFDGDGYADLAVGASANSVGGQATGTVFLYKGTWTGLVPWKTLQADGLVAGDRYGEALAAADVNADGYADLIVGAPGRIPSGGTTASGVVYVMLGAHTGPTAAGAQVIDPVSLGFTTNANVDGDNFGESLATGNFLGDTGKHLEVAMGAPGRANGAGRVYVAQWDTTSASLTELRTLGVDRNDGDDFGTSLAVGDIDGDGIDDLAVGAPQTDNAGHSGAVFLFLGGTTTTAFANEHRLAQPSSISPAPAAGDDFGQAVAFGRFDGSAGALAVGAPGKDNNSGRVIFFRLNYTNSMFTGIARWREIGQLPSDSGLDNDANDRFGNTLLVADFDQDSHDDLVAGIWRKNSDKGVVELFQGTDATDFVAYWAQYQRPDGTRQNGDHFGRALAAADFNLMDSPTAAHLPDLAMTAPGKQFGSSTSVGALWVARGRDSNSPKLAAANPTSVTPPPTSGDWMPGFWSYYDQAATNAR